MRKFEFRVLKLLKSQYNLKKFKKYFGPKFGPVRSLSIGGTSSNFYHNTQKLAINILFFSQTALTGFKLPSCTLFKHINYLVSLKMLKVITHRL